MSRLPFELFLALRYLRPKRTFVSVITLISVAGVMLGVAVLIIVISVMSGFDKQLRDKILGFNAHLRIYNSQDTIPDYPNLIRLIRSNPHVIGAAPSVVGQVLVETEPPAGNPLRAAPFIRGIEPRYETNVSMLHTSIVAGSFDLEGSGALVGRDLADGLNLNVGDRLAVYSPSSHQLEELRKGKQPEHAILPEEFTVRGIFDVGYYEYNANFVVVSLENAQDLYHLRNTVHHISVMLDDPFKADEIRSELFRVLPPTFQITLWSEERSVRTLLNALIVEKKLMFYILFFIMIVAAFGIMNSLITFVVQKTREIGMLKALGSTHGQVVWLFLSQSMAVGVAGVLTGFGLGMLAISYRNQFLHFLNRVTGFELFPASIYGFSELPALLSLSDIAIICGSALLICVLAGIIPAWTAARLEPVEALRHE